MFKKLNLARKIICLVLFLLFAILVILLKNADVKEYYYEVGIDTKVTDLGLYSFNMALRGNEYVKLWDIVADICLYVSLLTFVAFGVYGIIKLIKNKSFKGLEGLIVYACFMGVAIVLWILFDKVIKLNYRPFEFEGSFPSTHIFVITFMMISGIHFLSKLLKNKKNIVYALSIIACVLVLGAFGGKLLSNEHWITDCIGGLLLGGMLGYMTILVDEFISIKYINKEEEEA